MTFSDEVRHEKNFFVILKEHKEVIRALNSFDGVHLLLKPDIDRFMHVNIYFVFSISAILE